MKPLSSDIPYHELEIMIQKNDLKQAEEALKNILNDTPEDAEALHLYSILSYREGRLEAAISLSENSIRLNPINKRYWNTGGYLHRLNNNFVKSIDYLKKAISMDPNYNDALNNLGISYVGNRDFDMALEMYHRALQLKPDQADVLNNIGNLLAQINNYDEAIGSFNKAISIDPKYPQAWANKAEAILQRPDMEDAIRKMEYRETISRACELAPDWLELQWKYTNFLIKNKSLIEAEEILRKLLYIPTLIKGHVPLIINLARTLDQKFELEEALLWARQAAILSPDESFALQVFGHISLRIGHPLEALEIYKKALAIKSDAPDLYYGLGNCFMRLERIQEALDCYMKVHTMDKNNPRSIFAPAACLLLNGEYEKGWKAYDSRYRVDGFKPNVPDIMHRLWDGSPLKDRHLVVHVEQGFGDSFQFCRYLKVLKQREGGDCKITFLCEPENFRLMKGLEGPDEVLSLGDKHKINYDLQVPLLSLPERMKTTIDTIPNHLPYLSSLSTPPIKLLTRGKEALKVGIVWAGRPSHSDDRYRSVDLHFFTDLFELEEVSFYSLQWGERGKDINSVISQYSNVFDEKDSIVDFADTAAFIDQLDLVITVDTSVAHLAGAMNKPVWTLISYGAEWRWLLGHERTPWYPNMRLYRQKVLGHWGPVFGRIKNHLIDVIAERRKE